MSEASYDDNANVVRQGPYEILLDIDGFVLVWNYPKGHFLRGDKPIIYVRRDLLKKPASKLARGALSSLTHT